MSTTKKKIISLEVRDEYILGSGVSIGAVGSFDSVVLRVKFDDSWIGLNIYATWTDALGNVGDQTIITALDLVDGEVDTYDIPVSSFATQHAGTVKLSFSGYAISRSNDKEIDSVINTVSGAFRVLESNSTKLDGGNTAASVAEQLLNAQREFEKRLLEDQADFDANETRREQKENARQEAESERVKNESQRVLDESLRVQAETERVAAEESRQEHYEVIDELIRGIEDVQNGYISEESDSVALVNLKRVYPVGAIYMSVEETSPAELFGGTWERLKDRFLLGAGDTYEAGATGGSDAHSHTHDLWADICILSESSEHRSKGTVFMKEKQHENFVYMDYVLQDNGALTRVVLPSRGEAGAIGYKRATNVGGTIGTSSNMPPYLAVYMWKRVA